MDSKIAVSFISAIAAVAVAAISYVFTKWKEREADWRKYKFEQYKEFLGSISGIVGTDSTPEGQRNYAKACNTLHLIGSTGVINALHDFQEETRISNHNRNNDAHDVLLSRLIWEIRRDVPIPGTPSLSEFSARLWCSGTNDREKQN